MNALVVLIAGLGLPGLLPAVTLARRSPVVIFLAPLIGAAMAAVATELELATAGSLVLWYAVVAIATNAGLVGWWVARGRRPGAGSHPSPGWMLPAVAGVGALIIPVIGLRVGMFGWDAEQIWLTHAMMISGGHHELLASLKNHSYWSGNPDYPPLVPAVGALAFAFYGLSNLHLAVDMTVLLNACAVAVVAVGIATVGSAGRAVAKVGGIAAGFVICVVAFAISGIYGVNGYADLLWAAAAVASIIWGLVLPRSPRALAIAWTCAVVASLTKNEGLATSLVVLALIALRYVSAALPLLARLPAPEDSDGMSVSARWIRNAIRFAVLLLVPAVPGLAWLVLMRAIGLHDRFFSTSTYHESSSVRASATLHGMADHLAVLPVAIAVLLVGCWLFRRERERAGLGNPVWLWLACLASLAFVFYTYVAGSLEIHSWLASSVNRTTIFAQLLLFSELAMWLVIALDGTFPAKRDQSAAVAEPRRQPATQSLPQ
jgi:hypothetical protein